MTPHRRIVRKIMVEREGKRAAFQLDVRYRPARGDSRFRTAADAEVCLMAAREVRELAACQCNAVDLLKRVGEKSNTGMSHLAAV